MVCDIRGKNSIVVIISYAVLIGINIINGSASILGHSSGFIDNWYKISSKH